VLRKCHCTSVHPHVHARAGPCMAWTRGPACWPRCGRSTGCAQQAAATHCRCEQQLRARCRHAQPGALHSAPQPAAAGAAPSSTTAAAAAGGGDTRWPCPNCAVVRSVKYHPLPALTKYWKGATPPNIWAQRRLERSSCCTSPVGAAIVTSRPPDINSRTAAQT
jgi:hypothetical protein